MQRFQPPELLRFLAAVDAALHEPRRVIVIGGAAAALAYRVSTVTRDIDTWNKVDADLARAAQVAAQTTGLHVPLETASVSDGPHDFETRLHQVPLPFARLAIWVPERHDWALMKTARAYEHDIDAIAAVHRLNPLALDRLIHLYSVEMRQAVTDPERLALNFLFVVERMFGDAAAARVEQDLSRRDNVS